MMFYIDLLRNDVLYLLRIGLMEPIPLLVLHVVDNADITKAVKDFKIVDLRIMNSPNSSPQRGYNFNLYIIPYYI